MFLKKLQVDLKSQHSNSLNRDLENANFQNVFMWQYLYGIAEAVVQVFCKKDVLKNFPKFTGKHLYWSHF